MVDRDATFDINATDHSGPTVRRAADGFDRLGDKADKATRKIDDLGDETGQLARKLAEARVAALGLAREFDKTGDSKILKDFEKLNREAAKLGRVAKSIKLDQPKLDADGFLGRLTAMARESGLIAGNVAVDSFASAFNALPLEIKGPVLASALILVGALQGAVTAAVAGGGLAAGIALAAQDDRVKTAYAALGTSIFTSLKEDAAPFRTELLDAAPQLQKAFDAQSPRIRRIFENLAADIDPILSNVISAVDEIAPAIERAAAAGGKVLISVTGTLPVLASATGDLLDSMSDSSSGAAASLNILVLAIAGVVKSLAFMNTYMSPVLTGLGKLADITGVTNDNVKHLDTIQRNAGQGAGLTAQQYAMLAYDLGSTAGMARALQESFDRLFSAQMGVDQANLAVNIGMAQLTETIKGNKKTLDEHTEAGQQNMQVILNEIGALNQKRQADIAAGNGTAEATAQANAAYVSQLEGLRKLLYSLGLNHAEVDRLIAAYEALAQPQTKVFTTVYRTQGTPPGYSDEKTGHSRTGGADYGALDGWGPAAFNARSHAEVRMTGEGGGMPHQPPVQVENSTSVNVSLDGRPFHSMIVSTVSAAEKRQAWRARVGRRSG